MEFAEMIIYDNIWKPCVKCVFIFQVLATAHLTFMYPFLTSLCSWCSVEISFCRQSGRFKLPWGWQGSGWSGSPWLSTLMLNLSWIAFSLSVAEWRSGNRWVLIERWSLRDNKSWFRPGDDGWLQLHTNGSFPKCLILGSCRLEKFWSSFLAWWSSLGCWLTCFLLGWFEFGDVWDITALIRGGVSTTDVLTFCGFLTETKHKNHTHTNNVDTHTDMNT